MPSVVRPLVTFALGSIIATMVMALIPIDLSSPSSDTIDTTDVPSDDGSAAASDRASSSSTWRSSTPGEF